MSGDTKSPNYEAEVTPAQYKGDVLSHFRRLNEKDSFLGNHFHGNRALYLRVGLKEDPVLFTARSTREDLKAVLGEQDFLEALAPIQTEYEEKHAKHHG